MRPLNFTVIILSIFSYIHVCSADTIKLKNKKEITGNILQENKETGMVVIDTVEDNQLTGIKLILFAHEIESITRDGLYKDAPVKEIRICYQYGYHWGRCTMSAYFGYTCIPDEKYTIPSQCSDTPDLKKGVRAGVKSVYVDFPHIPNKKTNNEK